MYTGCISVPFHSPVMLQVEGGGFGLPRELCLSGPFSPDTQILVCFLLPLFPCLAPQPGCETQKVGVRFSAESSTSVNELELGGA